MTGESTNCSNFKNVGLSKSMSLINNKYLVVKEEDEIISVIKMPTTMSTAFVVYLGSSSVELSSVDNISNGLNTNGVYWK